MYDNNLFRAYPAFLPDFQECNLINLIGKAGRIGFVPAERMKMNQERNREHDNINLSDFILFLSVMKDKRAYQNALSIILDEPDIQIQEVKVEQVILNKLGLRAIRLDAWALSTDERQFNMEMQNSSGSDYIPKRSRFYQGLMDSPFLKAGKNTKYKDLPSTVIIFITQDDIFKRDRAK